MNKQVHLCKTCKFDYPQCPARYMDIEFDYSKTTGHYGNDNVIRCTCYIENTTKGD